MPDAIIRASDSTHPFERLIAPYGGRLSNLFVDSHRTARLKVEAGAYPTWTLTPRQLCDLELIVNGAFSPLRGFLARADYGSVCRQLRLSDGTLWPLPITLDVTAEVATRLGRGDRLALREPEGRLLAVLTVEDVWQPDQDEEARRVFGTTDTDHPGVASRAYRGGSAGSLRGRPDRSR